MRARLAELADLLRAEIVFGDPERTVDGASIDTRRIRPRELFFALSGCHEHGVRFVAEAWRQGAPAAIVPGSRLSEVEIAGRPQDAALLAVDSPERALAEWARRVRLRDADRIPAVAITGSVGKTTTCRYAAALLARAGHSHRPMGSFNNHLGVPLTILGAPEETQFLVSEVGTNHAGEVHRLASWVRPKVAIVTAIGPAHLENFRTIEAIEIEKLSILDALVDGGEGWVPVDLAERQRSLMRSFAHPISTFGPGGDLEVVALGESRFELRCPKLGVHESFEWTPPFSHSIRNLESAFAAGLSLGVPAATLVSGVTDLETPPLRGETRVHGGVEFVLDCYNANPASMISAIERLESEPSEGRRICVVGTMEELGEEAPAWHRRVAGRLASEKLDDIFVLGRGRDWYASGLRDHGREARSIDNDESSAQRLAERLVPGDRVLFKASRVEALERFADRVGALLEERGTTR